jgi:ketol-acid reductoisomerase
VSEAAGATVAILGFGHQGEAQSLNLRDSGRRVRVGARPGGAGDARARALGFEVLAPGDAAAGADCAAVLLPDEVVPGLWPDLAPRFRPDATLVFAHGYNLLYSDLAVAPAQTVVLVSPTAPGSGLRRLFERGERVPAYVAVHRDGGRDGFSVASAYASAIGCGPLWRTTVREETEVDLFGEQAVLCGGMNALVTTAFETLVAHGYAPEMAYLECVHQLKYLADLLHERGVAGMRRAISGTALYGDLTRGPRVVGPEARAAMERLLAEIRSGAFAREWGEEVAGGRRRLADAVGRAGRHPIEEARRRALRARPGAGD